MIEAILAGLRSRAKAILSRAQPRENDGKHSEPQTDRDKPPETIQEALHAVETILASYGLTAAMQGDLAPRSVPDLTAPQGRRAIPPQFGCRFEIRGSVHSPYDERKARDVAAAMRRLPGVIGVLRWGPETMLVGSAWVTLGHTRSHSRESASPQTRKAIHYRRR